MVSSSMSRPIFSSLCPVCLARVDSSHFRILSISLAWISISLAFPKLSPMAGWCMRTLALGKISRLPLAPAARITDAALVACPRHTVDTSGFTYCMVS